MSGPRVIVRNTGPRGAAGNTGNTGGINGPTASIPGGIAVFADEVGNAVNDSGVLVSALATKSAVALKQDAESGKGLSSNDYTNSDKAKLARLDGAYRGSFTKLIAIEAHNFSPAPAAGDYCLIEVEDSPVVLVLWDETNLSWVEFSHDVNQMSGQEIANVLFKESDAAGWTKELCRVFTHGDKATLDLIVSQVNGVVTALGNQNYVEKTVAYTMSAGDRMVNCTANSFTVTLPSAVGQAGLTYTIKNSGEGTIIVATFGDETIDGAATETLADQWGSLTVASTGANWIIV